MYVRLKKDAYVHAMASGFLSIYTTPITPSKTKLRMIP